MEGGVQKGREEKEEEEEREEENCSCQLAALLPLRPTRLSGAGGTKAPRQARSPLSPLSVSCPHRSCPTSLLECPQFMGISAWRAEEEIAEAVITVITPAWARTRPHAFTSCDALHGVEHACRRLLFFSLSLSRSSDFPPQRESTGGWEEGGGGRAEHRLLSGKKKMRSSQP